MVAVAHQGVCELLDGGKAVPVDVVVDLLTLQALSGLHVQGRHTHAGMQVGLVGFERRQDDLVAR